MQTAAASIMYCTEKFRRHIGWYILVSTGLHVVLWGWITWRRPVAVDMQMPITLLAGPSIEGAGVVFAELAAVIPVPSPRLPALPAPLLPVAPTAPQVQAVTTATVAPPLPALPREKPQKRLLAIAEPVPPPSLGQGRGDVLHRDPPEGQETRARRAPAVVKPSERRHKAAAPLQVNSASPPTASPQAEIASVAMAPQVPPEIPQRTAAQMLSAPGEAAPTGGFPRPAEIARVAAGTAQPPGTLSQSSTRLASQQVGRGQEVYTTAPHFVRQTEPEYPLMARRRGIEGVVTLRIEMLADGSVGEIKIVQSSGSPLLDRSAQQAVKQWTHTPATQQGQSVTRWANLDIRFTLDQERR